MTPGKLAVHSEAAQPFNDFERLVRAAIGRHYRATILATGSDSTPVDALWVRQGVCVGCSEHKVRTHSREQMRAWGDTYLITEQKLTDGLELGRILAVPFYVVALLVPDQTCYAWHIVPESWAKAVTTTQSTCNGGWAARTNAFLDFAHAETFPLRAVLGGA